MKFKLFILVFVISFIKGLVAQGGGRGSDGATMDDTVRLIDAVISANDPRFRPIANQSSAMEVLLTGYLLTLLSIDEVKQKVEINVWLNLTWEDEVRRWDPANYGGIGVIHPNPTDIWRPQVFVINSLVGRDVIEKTLAPVSLFASGKTQWYPGSIVEAYCHLDLRYYPYDHQECSLEIYTSNFPNELILQPTSPNLRLNHYASNGEWTLMSSTIRSVVSKIGQEDSTMVKMTIKLKRKPQSFVANVLVPVMLFSLLSMLVFVLPRDSGERASFSTTIVLSMAVFLSSVSDNLPKNAESFPLIVIYLLCLLVLGSLVVTTNVFVLAWHYWHSGSSKTETSVNREQKSEKWDGKRGPNDSQNAQRRRSSRVIHQDSGLNYLYDLNSDSTKLYKEKIHVPSPVKANQISPLPIDFPENILYAAPVVSDDTGDNDYGSRGSWPLLMKWMSNADMTMLTLFLIVWFVISVSVMVLFFYNG